MQAVRHDLSRDLPKRKSKLSGYLWCCAFIKMNCMCLFSVYLFILNKFRPSPSPSRVKILHCSAPRHYLNQWRLFILLPQMMDFNVKTYQNQPIFNDEIALQISPVIVLPRCPGGDGLYSITAWPGTLLVSDNHMLSSSHFSVPWLFLLVKH